MSIPDSALETSMVSLLNKIGQLVKPRLVVRQKWRHFPKGRAELVDQVDRFESILIPVITADHPDITALRKIAEQHYAEDRILGEATKLAGYYGSFDAFLQGAVRSAGRLGRKAVSMAFDGKAVTEYVHDRREFFNKTRFEYVCSTRINDLTIRRRLKIGSVAIRNLTLAELNREEPFLAPFLPSTPGTELHVRAAASFEFSMAIDRRRDSAYFEVGQRALTEATRVLDRTLEAVSVASGTALSYGTISLVGGFDSGIRMLRPIEAPFAFLSLGAKDVPRAEQALALLETPDRDRTLSACLNRIVLAHKRLRVTDRLVDLVIAWESITLTSAGSAIRDELSYRFAVNGTLLVLASGGRNRGRTLFNQFKAAYSARSTIVHGGSESEVEKEAVKGGFANSIEVAQFLDEGLRSVLDWLAKRKPSERPYRATGGWERLLWEQ